MEEIPPGEMWAGKPAQYVCKVTEDDFTGNNEVREELFEAVQLVREQQDKADVMQKEKEGS